MSDELNRKISIQGLVPEEIAAKFQAACKFHGLTQKEALGRMAELYVRLPPRQQGTLSVALRDDQAFADFMQAVNDVLADAILGRLPDVGPSVAELRARVDAREAKSRPRQARRGSRRKEAG